MLETLDDLAVEFDDLSVASETLLDTVLEARSALPQCTAPSAT